MLPIDALLPTLLDHLDQHPTLLLQAPPGAGKTTRVPLALLDCGWMQGQRLLMLEPRRLAARAAARFMAAKLGEAPGGRVGYRTRQDSRIGPDTRIEVVTEGILTRLIQQDPELSGYAAVVFDEFHERSLQADLGLALVREVQTTLREDLRVLIMSATLDTAGLAERLGQVPVLTSEGRAFSVDVHYRPLARGQDLFNPRDLVARVVSVIHEALVAESGSLLVFLPGTGEIRRVAEALRESGLPSHVSVHALHGSLDAGTQDRAILPAPLGERKIVLATAIAETSLTIEGVRVVIDAGLQRRAVFDPGSGMTRLATTRVSAAAAEQRKGRAGRREPGVCYRLYSESQQAALAPFTPPEILEADLAPLALELACWGVRDTSELFWLDPPPTGHLQQARTLLRELDALDASDQLTPHGRALWQQGLHPRLAHMRVRARDLKREVLAAQIAALLEERDPLGPAAGADLRHRLQALRESRGGRFEPIRQAARRWMPKDAAAGERQVQDLDSVGELLALAFPDRVARRRPGGAPRYLLANGRGAWLTEEDPLGDEPWVVAAELDGQAREARIFLAAPISPEGLEAVLGHHFQWHEVVAWDDRRGVMLARRECRLGALLIAEEALPEPPPERLQQALLDAVRHRGLDSLPWTDEACQWCARVTLLHLHDPEAWPDCREVALEADLEDWLGPWLQGCRTWADLQRVNLLAALSSRLDYGQQQSLEALAPRALVIPAGVSVALDYTAEQGPVLAAKLQGLFGWESTPRIVQGRVPVVIHLLSPAQRPLAVTTDLANFWREVYPQVRKEQRGRYPKHPWPEDPLSAEARLGTRKQGF